MVMNAVEVMAALVILGAAIKLLVVIIKPRAWLKFAKKAWKNPKMLNCIYLVASLVVLYFLVQSGITITQILAVSLFIGLLVGMSMTSYAGEIFKVFEKAIKKRTLLKDDVFYIVVWIVLLVWGAIELLA